MPLVGLGGLGKERLTANHAKNAKRWRINRSKQGEQRFDSPSQPESLGKERGSATVSVAPVGVSPTESEHYVVRSFVNPFRIVLMFGVPGELCLLLLNASRAG